MISIDGPNHNPLLGLLKYGTVPISAHRAFRMDILLKSLLTLDIPYLM